MCEPFHTYTDISETDARLATADGALSDPVLPPARRSSIYPVNIIDYPPAPPPGARAPRPARLTPAHAQCTLDSS